MSDGSRLGSFPYSALRDYLDHTINVVSPKNTAMDTTLPHSPYPCQEYPFQFPTQWQTPHHAIYNLSRQEAELSATQLTTALIEDCQNPPKYHQPIPASKLPKGWCTTRPPGGSKPRGTKTRPCIGCPASVNPPAAPPIARPRAQPILSAPQGYKFNRGLPISPLPLLTTMGDKS